MGHTWSFDSWFCGMFCLYAEGTSSGDDIYRNNNEYRLERADKHRRERKKGSAVGISDRRQKPSDHFHGRNAAFHS